MEASLPLCSNVIYPNATLSHATRRLLVTRRQVTPGLSRQ